MLYLALLKLLLRKVCCFRLILLKKSAIIITENEDLLMTLIETGIPKELLRVDQAEQQAMDILVLLLGKGTYCPGYKLGWIKGISMSWILTSKGIPSNIKSPPST